MASKRIAREESLDELVECQELSLRTSLMCDQYADKENKCVASEIMGRKSWQEKMIDKKSLPKILKLEQKFPCYNAVHKMGAKAGDKVVLVNPSEVVEMMRDVPNGKLITIAEICKKIAKKHQVEACCSLTTGIFIMTIANAAEEAAKEGRDLKIPYWRTLKTNGFLNEKYPGGAEAHKKLLEREGFKIIQKGKKFVVDSYQKNLVDA